MKRQKTETDWMGGSVTEVYGPPATAMPSTVSETTRRWQHDAVAGSSAINVASTYSSESLDST